MVERRYADYLRTADTTDLGRAPAVGSVPGGDASSAVWLQRVVDLVEGPDDPAADAADTGPWVMTLEVGGRATNEQGEFRQLVEIARVAGVGSYYVWSPDQADFIRFTAETVTELPPYVGDDQL